MPTDKKIIDAYNREAQKYAKRQRDDSNIYRVYLERPAMYSKLPKLENKSVLCLGCGSGEEVEHLSSLGAAKIVGIDISEKLIEIAKASYPHFEFHVMDAEHLDFPHDSFDFVFSSLTLHYLESWKKTFDSVGSVLKKNGVFLFSITHPFFSATEKYEDEKIKSRILGYKDVKEEERVEVYGNYLDSYKLDAYISKVFTVTNYRKPFSAIIKEITGSGFELLDIVEPKAPVESREQNPKFWEIHQKIPEFAIFELMKK